jgi:oleandomycin transport system permease protein
MSALTTTLTRSPATVSHARTLRHALAVAKRNLIKTWRTPEQLIDVTLQPIIFLLLFVYVFGGAISGGARHDYLQFLLPGILGQGIAMGSVALGQNLNADIEKGVFDRFRSLPIARFVPLLGAVLADFFRYLIVCVIYLGFGYALGFRIATNPLATIAAVALSIAFALCFCWISVFVGMKARTSGAVQGIMFLLIFPLSFGSNVFVQANTMRQPDDASRRRGARPDGRRPGALAPRLDVAVDGHPARGVRAARDARLPPSRVTRPMRTT